MAEDIMIDCVPEQVEAGRQVIGIQSDSQIKLKAGFRLQVRIAGFVTKGTFVFTVRSQFGNIGCAEAPRQVKTRWIVRRSAR